MRKLLIAGMLACVACAKDEPLKRFEFHSRKMATQVDLIFYARGDSAAERAARAAFARMEQIDSLLSDFRTNSEVASLATQPAGTPVPASPELSAVMETALEMSRASDGAFDVTVGPVSKLWRDARRADSIPSARSVCAAMQSVGSQHVALDSAARTIRFDRAGMQLDFGGIAKGYAADEAIAVLKTEGVTSVLITFGGEIVSGDAPPGETGWPISIEGFTGPVLLTNAALSTSGDAFQFIEIDGVRYSHVIDPRTGSALTNRITATVRAPTGMLADALATTVGVLDSAGAARIIRAHPGAELLARIEDTAAAPPRAGPSCASKS